MAPDTGVNWVLFGLFVVLWVFFFNLSKLINGNKMYVKWLRVEYSPVKQVYL